MTPTPEEIARDAARELARLARPLAEFDPARFFRAAERIKFHGVPTPVVRNMARTIDRLYGSAWRIDGATAFAALLMRSEYIDEKSLGIEVVARHRHEFTKTLLPVWKRWLASGPFGNWATTDGICGSLIGPLLVREPRLARTVAAWSTDRRLWVRRASAVALIPLLRSGSQLDLGYKVARRLHSDGHDLIQKAVGWMLREAGKADMQRLERYLRKNGSRIPRTTLRYAIERFSPAKRRTLLAATKG